MKNQVKLLAVLALCLVLLAALIPAAGAAEYEAGDGVDVYLDFTALLAFPDKQLYGFPWMATKYCTAAEGGNTLTTSGDWVYCIDYDSLAAKGVSSSTATDPTDTPSWRNLSRDAQYGITYALLYGCPTYSNELYGYAATQLIIWEYQLGLRTDAEQTVGKFSATLAQSSRLKTAYDSILAEIVRHQTPPSFNFATVELAGYGRENGVTLSDSNGIFRNDEWFLKGSPSGVAVEQTGDSLFVYATEELAPNTPVNVTLGRKLHVSTGNAVCVISGEQQAILGNPPDPLAVTLKVNVSASGGLKIIKTAEDGNVAGISFRITGKDFDQTGVTDANGTLLLEKLTPGQYVVTELDAPERYAAQQPQSITVLADQVAEVKFNNVLKRGTVHGRKVDPNGTEISGAVFGLFRPDETDFSRSNAVQLSTSGKDGVFTFADVAYGSWLIRELSPAPGFLPNEEIYPVTISGDGQKLEIIAINYRTPEIGTKADIGGNKVVGATEQFTLTDTVSYKHLIPGKEYVLRGILMDKSTGRPFLQKGQEITAETVFIPEAADGEVTVSFTFDAQLIQTETEIVVFESLYRDGRELAVHADIDDGGQTVTVVVPEIGTKASVGGKKEVAAKGDITIEDTVSYKNLTPGKEYAVTGELMDKTTGKPFLVDGRSIIASTVFTPETPDGEVKVIFTFDASAIASRTELVVFETLYRESVLLTAHADINDGGQTVTLLPPPKTPQTGDGSNIMFWCILCGAAALAALFFLSVKKSYPAK